MLFILRGGIVDVQIHTPFQSVALMHRFVVYQPPLKRHKKKKTEKRKKQQQQLGGYFSISVSPSPSKGSNCRLNNVWN